MKAKYYGRRALALASRRCEGGGRFSSTTANHDLRTVRVATILPSGDGAAYAEAITPSTTRSHP